MRPEGARLQATLQMDSSASAVSGAGRKSLKRPTHRLAEGIKARVTLDIGHADFEGQQFVYCKKFKSVHKETRMDHVFFIPPRPFYYVGGRRRHSEFDLALDNVWYGRVALPFKIMMTVRTDSNQLRDVECAMIDVFFDYMIDVFFDYLLPPCGGEGNCEVRGGGGGNVSRNMLHNFQPTVPGPAHWSCEYSQPVPESVPLRLSRVVEGSM